MYVGSAGSTLDHIEVRNGGQYYRPQLVVGGDVTVTDSTSRQSLGPGLDVPGGSPSVTGSVIKDNNTDGIYVTGGNPLISGNTVEGNSSRGIHYKSDSTELGQVRVTGNNVRDNAQEGIYIEANPRAPSYQGFEGISFSGNTVTGNGLVAIRYWANGQRPLPPDIDENPPPSGNGGDYVDLSGVVTTSTTWEDPGYALVFSGPLGVGAGSTLTLDAGLVLKGRDPNISEIDVDGALDAAGTSSNPVTITSFKDDSAGGDTNGDGSLTSPAARDWDSFFFDEAGGGTIEYAKIGYGGGSVGTMIWAYSMRSSGVPLGILHSTLKDSPTAIYVHDDGDPLGPDMIVERNRFRDNTTYGVQKRWGILPLVARYNDWDCDSGPKPLFGCGNAASALVYPSPWIGADLDNGMCPGGDSQCPVRGEPVVLSTGAFTHAHEDLRLTNKGLPLVVSRSYYSQDPADAGLGPGWSFDGLLSATEEENGDVVVRRADGRRDTYTLSGDTYTAPSGIHDVLTKDGDGTFTLTTLNRTLYEFDQTGRIDRITDDHGQAIDCAYDTNGRLSSMADSSGQSIAFTYDSSNHITKATDSAGREVQYGYDASKRLTSVTDPLGGVARYTYDDKDRITAIEDPNQTTFIRNTYDSEDRVTLQEEGLGNQWDIDYQDGSATVEEPEGGITTTTFDSLLRTSQETDHVGNTTTYSYDAQGNIDHVIRPGGADHASVYDSHGNLTQTTDPQGNRRDFTYDERNHLTSFTDARLKTWDFIWDDQDDLRTIRDPIGYETAFTYDQAGLPLTATDPLSHTTTYAYDARGNPTSVTDPLNHATAYTYDQYNNLTSVTEPDKGPETYGRNALGDLLSATNPEGEETSFAYDGNGELTRITDPELHSWAIERNAMEKPSAIVDPLTKRTEIAYDGNLNPTSVTDRRGNQTTYAYDDANRLITLTKPEGGAYHLDYDARSNLDELTDPRGNLTTYAHDLADRLTALAEPEDTTTSYGYDGESNLTRVTDPRGNQTTFGYDDLGLLTEIAQPLEKTTTFTYDEAQNLKTRTTAAGTLSYFYDPADRLREIKEGEDILRAFAYDDANRMTAATNDQSQTLAIVYDQADRPTSIDDGLGQTATLAYDDRGNLTTQQDARGATGYAFDELGRLGAVTDPQGQTTAFAYDEEGNLQTTTYPNGVVSQKTHDKDGRVTEIDARKDAEAIDKTTYAYDANANRQSMTNRSGSKTSYAYDRLNRLTQMSNPPFKITKFPAGKPLSGIPRSPTAQRPYQGSLIKAWTTAYAYDKAGNLTQKGSTAYTYNDLNELVSASDGTTYAYDQAGRLTGKTKGSDSETYSYDLFDQLREVTKQGQTKTFVYDALGRQTARTLAGQTENTHYSDLADIATFDTDQGGQVSRSYVSALPTASGSADLVDGILRSTVSLPNQAAVEGILALTPGRKPIGRQAGAVDPGGLIQDRANGTSTYPLADAQGDVTATTDQAGSVQSRKTFDPWGMQTSGSRDALGYLGAYLRRTDPDTGLTQMGARQYDPGISRFTSEDEIVGLPPLGQSWNRYPYVINNPLLYLDLDGRSFVDDWVTPAVNTAGNMARPWKWDELGEDVREGWTHEPYASIAEGIRSIQAKLLTIMACTASTGTLWDSAYLGAVTLGAVAAPEVTVPAYLVAAGLTGSAALGGYGINEMRENCLN